MAEPPFITRVTIENYKSIAHCDVRLGPLSFLVGRNGAGKSNFLDALRFISDALLTTPDQAIRDRGNFYDLRYRGAEPDAPIVLGLEMTLPHGQKGRYRVALAPQPGSGFRVADEQCTIEYPQTGHAPIGFHIRDRLPVNHPNRPVGRPIVAPGQLYLPIWPQLGTGRPVYDLLTRMAFYQPIPNHMRSPHRHDQGNLLLPDGSNCASVLLRLAREQPQALERIAAYLQAIVPSLERVQGAAVRDYDVLEFIQVNAGQTQGQPFGPMSMSDGTLHALAVLTALFQAGFSEDRAVTVIGIEEPETALHPAATAVLRDAFADTAELSQVIVTTQSPDLLDDKDIAADAIVAVVSHDGATTLGRLGEGQQSIIRDHLATAGELLRTSDFQPALSSSGA